MLTRAEQHQQPRQQVELFYERATQVDVKVAQPHDRRWPSDNQSGQEQGSPSEFESRVVHQFYSSDGAMSGEAQAKTPTLAPCTDSWECPQCGESDGTPVDYDFGQSAETGYHDAGIACTKCMKRS